MLIKRLRLENFRNLTAVNLELHPRLNFFFGANGAGKTSLLEAVYLLSRGKSFRTTQAEELVGTAPGPFRVYLELERANAGHRLGLERQGNHWRARLDGQDVTLLSQLSHYLPLVLMEPNSHLLVSGGPDVRRRFMDWGAFHVEHQFLEDWRQYARALRQRNAALRRREQRVLDSLDQIVAHLGERLSEHRSAYFSGLEPHFTTLVRQSTPELAAVELRYHAGWRADSLLQALENSRDRDLERGATQPGPHRADLVITCGGRSVKNLLSRGEQKSVAAALLLAQARIMATGGEPPLVLLDDLASEFDQRHYREVLGQACASAGQVWVSGIAPPPLTTADQKVFHVEHGVVQEMV